MTITQTVDVPADRRIIVPPEVPTGPVILTFTPMSKTERVEFIDAEAEEVIIAGDKILNKHIAAFEALAK